MRACEYVNYVFLFVFFRVFFLKSLIYQYSKYIQEYKIFPSLSRIF